jgi:hypothetical protein
MNNYKLASNLWTSLAIALLTSAPLLATTATSLSSFGGVEEPTVIYYPATNTFANDSYVNITDQGGGVFRMYLRYSTSWWDGDRNTTSTDRQRAEIKVLGARQLMNETYEYTSTWKTNSSFVKGNHFCHVTQVKAYDGSDTSDPLVTTDINSTSSAQVSKCSYGEAGLTGVRSFSWSPGTPVTVKVRLTTSSTMSGQLRASVNGDALSGQTGINMYRNGATEYQPKWGLYRGLDSSEPIGNDYVEHSNVQANKVASGTTTAMEAESLARTSSGATTSLQSDTNSSGGTWVQLDSTDNAGDYVEYTTTSITAGSYSVQMMWKGNTNRGILTLKVDGVQVGGTLDQYSSTQIYPTTTFGTVTFASSGTHKIRLTVAGKNSSSGNYYLSADKFTFVAQ